MCRTAATRSTVATPAMTGARRLTLTLYIIAVFLYWIALYLYVPTLPVYTASKTDNLALVGVVLSMYGLWQAIIRLPLGITADWLGRRKPFIIGGFALAGLGAWTMGSADNVNGLILGRAITGLAAGTWVPLVVVFSSLFPPEEAVRASAMLTLIGSVGRMLATGITGSLNNLGGYSLPFFLAAGAAVLAILIVLPAREERRSRRRPSIKGIGHLITRRDVLLPSVLSAVAQYANWAATFGFIPILARQLGATDVMLSMLTSMNIAVLTLGNLTATAIVKRIGARRLVYISFLLLAVGIGGAALAPTLPLVFAAQFCIGMSMGIGYPVLMGLSIQNVEDAERTTAMGLHQAVYAIGMFSGPGLSGTIADAIGIRAMFGITAGVALALGVLGTRWLGGRE
ncbi:MAG: MFS transporter [Chloroflexi bacterium]|nr:MFS transporter [Chloroflexota bacterium]